MRNSNKIKLLTKAKEEFSILLRNSRRKAKIFKFFDLFIKAVLAIAGALITYSSDEKSNFGPNFIRTMGIIISGLTAISSVFTLEKRSHSNVQIHSKCKSLLPEIEEKILLVSEQNGDDSNDNSVEELADIQVYIRNIFQELSKLSLASFTDSTYEKINQE